MTAEERAAIKEMAEKAKHRGFYINEHERRLSEFLAEIERLQDVNARQLRHSGDLRWANETSEALLNKALNDLARLQDQKRRALDALVEARMPLSNWILKARTILEEP